MQPGVSLGRPRLPDSEKKVLLVGHVYVELWKLEEKFGSKEAARKLAVELVRGLVADII